MEVYKIIEDVDRFQSFGCDNTNLLDFDLTCEPLLTTWQTPEVYVPKPRLKRGNFYRFLGIAMDEGAVQKLSKHLTNCELLPLKFKTQTVYLMNVLECVDCLDLTKSKIDCLLQDSEYYFDYKRLPTSTLFKIPQQNRVDVFTITGSGSDDFKTTVERERLSGLLFEKVWSSD